MLGDKAGRIRRRKPIAAIIADGGVHYAGLTGGDQVAHLLFPSWPALAEPTPFL